MSPIPHAMITESTDDCQRRPARAVLRGFAAGDVQIIRSKGRLAVNFELSERQYAFRDLMRDFARRSISPVAREMELAGRYPDEIVEEMKAMGLFGMLVPEEHGGIAIDAVSYSIVFEEISKAWMGIAGILGSHSLATLMLSKFGTPEQRSRWLPCLAAKRDMVSSKPCPPSSSAVSTSRAAPWAWHRRASTAHSPTRTNGRLSAGRSPSSRPSS